MMVDLYLAVVARVLRNAGMPEGDIDDEVELTFGVAAGRLEAIPPGAEKGFLFRVALHRTAHVRRTLARRGQISINALFERSETFPPPEELTDQKRMRQMLDDILDRLDWDRRAVFVLYEFEEMTVPEIAAVLRIPRGTVASRLRRARAEFRERVAALERLSRREIRQQQVKSPTKH
jgi:RNA polymerase sigma-70 factor, ECF subfamily